MIQVGAIVAVIVYFRQDIWRIVSAWVRGIAKPEVRGSFDYRMGWYVIVGTIPVGVVGLLGQGPGHRARCATSGGSRRR